MLKEKIEKYFNKYSGLRVLFHFDPEMNSEQEFIELELTGIRKVKFSNNFFRLKVLLNGEWINEKVFLYLNIPSPGTQAEYKAFPLLDLLVANKELRTDDEADFMEDFGLGRHQKDIVKKYIKELQFTKVQEVVKPVLTAGRFNESELIQGLMSAFLDLTKIEEWEVIIGKILSYTVSEKEKDFVKIKNKVQILDLLDVLNNKFDHFFKYRLKEFTISEISELIRRLKYNAVTRNFDVKSDDPYKALKISDQSILAAQIVLLEVCFKHKYISQGFNQAIELHAKNIQESTIFRIYGAEADYGYIPDILKWEIIQHYIKEIDHNPVYALEGLTRLSLSNNSSAVIKSMLNFVIYLSEMVRQINSISSYIFDKPDDYIKIYTDEYFKIDQYYRNAIIHFNRIEESDLPVDFDRSPLKNLLEKRYEEFNDKLNRQWLKCLSETGFDYSKINTSKQYRFFDSEIKPYEQKVAVIISDALRFEVAQELLTELHRDEKNQASIRYQLASLPSETSFGMANLLPGKDYKYSEGKISVDGQSVDKIEERANVLKSIKQTYHAVSFDTVYHNTQAQNRDLFKSELVYIYHDVIDKEGHKGNERNTFIAVLNAISEIKEAVKKIHSSYNVSRVIITADHGFLYNDKKIADADKDKFPDVESSDSSPRFVITNKIDKKYTGYVVPLEKTSLMKGDYNVLIPLSVNRIMKAGGRYQYVHGGGSLQELIVPIIDSSRKRQEIEAKVNPILVTRKFTIVSNSLKIQILQEKKISKVEKERVILVGLYYETDLVSNLVEINLNAVSDLPSERSFYADLAITSKASGKTILRLKIFDSDDRLNALIDEKVMNNTLIERDF